MLDIYTECDPYCDIDINNDDEMVALPIRIPRRINNNTRNYDNNGNIKFY